jgi:hypothetical protein
MGGMFSLPSYVTEGPGGMVYASDPKVLGEGAVIQVDPNTGQQSLVATGGFINGSNALAFVNGYIYVADEGDASGSVDNLVPIDPNSGLQKLVTDCGGFTVPTGMAVAPGNKSYVTSLAAMTAGDVRPSTPPAAFMLVELLVVIAIVGVLLALLLGARPRTFSSLGTFPYSFVKG